MKRYPDTITITQYGEPTKDASGNYGASPTVGTHTSDCRFQPAGARNTIQGDDGELISFDYIVFMPKVNLRFNYGDPIAGQHNSGYGIIGKVKRHHNTQHHTKLWV